MKMQKNDNNDYDIHGETLHMNNVITIYLKLELQEEEINNNGKT